MRKESVSLIITQFYFPRYGAISVTFTALRNADHKIPRQNNVGLTIIANWSGFGIVCQHLSAVELIFKLACKDVTIIVLRMFWTGLLFGEFSPVM